MRSTKAAMLTERVTKENMMLLMESQGEKVMLTTNIEIHVP